MAYSLKREIGLPAPAAIAAKSGAKARHVNVLRITTMARLMQEAGVPALLVGDSAANVILGHPTTLRFRSSS